MRDGRRTRAIARASVALVCAAVAAGAFAQGRTTGREPADDATPRRGTERAMGARAIDPNMADLDRLLSDESIARVRPPSL